jgi:uncharacterized protein (TIGR00369 family)
VICRSAAVTLCYEVSGMKTVSMELMRQFTEEAVPFNRWMGMKLVECELGCALTVMPFKEDLIGDFMRPAIHGGIISALLDATGGTAVFTHLSMYDRVSTVDLRVDFLRPGRPEQLFCRARLVRMGNRVAVVSCTCFHAGEEHEPVAMAMAVYNVKRAHGLERGAAPAHAGLERGTREEG